MPVTKSQIEFTKMVSPPGPVTAGTQLTYTFRVKNNSGREVQFRILDKLATHTSLGGNVSGIVSVPNQPGWEGFDFGQFAQSFGVTADGPLSPDPSIREQGG